MAKDLFLIAILHVVGIPFALADADQGVPRSANPTVGPVGIQVSTTNPDPNPAPSPSPSPSPVPVSAPKASGVPTTVNPVAPQNVNQTPVQTSPSTGGMPMIPMMPMMPAYSPPSGFDGDYGDDYGDELYGGGSSSGGGSSGGGSSGGGAPDNTPTASRAINGRHPIVGPFKEEFDKCLNKVGLSPSCKFENWGIMGDKAHQRRRSCHNTGEAIDVGPIHCDGAKYDSKHPKFLEMAKCMANNSGEKFKVLFHTAHPPNLRYAPNHTGHMHIQLKTCVPKYGGG